MNLINFNSKFRQSSGTDSNETTSTGENSITLNSISIPDPSTSQFMRNSADSSPLEYASGVGTRIPINYINANPQVKKLSLDELIPAQEIRHSQSNQYKCLKKNHSQESSSYFWQPNEGRELNRSNNTIVKQNDTQPTDEKINNRRGLNLSSSNDIHRYFNKQRLHLISESHNEDEKELQGSFETNKQGSAGIRTRRQKRKSTLMNIIKPFRSIDAYKTVTNKSSLHEYKLSQLEYEDVSEILVLSSKVNDKLDNIMGKAKDRQKKSHQGILDEPIVEDNDQINSFTFVSKSGNAGAAIDSIRNRLSSISPNESIIYGDEAHESNSCKVTTEIDDSLMSANNQDVCQRRESFLSEPSLSRSAFSTPVHSSVVGNDVSSPLSSRAISEFTTPKLDAVPDEYMISEISPREKRLETIGVNDIDTNESASIASNDRRDLLRRFSSEFRKRASPASTPLNKPLMHLKTSSFPSFNNERECKSSSTRSVSGSPFPSAISSPMPIIATNPFSDTHETYGGRLESGDGSKGLWVTPVPIRVRPRLKLGWDNSWVSESSLSPRANVFSEYRSPTTENFRTTSSLALSPISRKASASGGSGKKSTSATTTTISTPKSPLTHEFQESEDDYFSAQSSMSGVSVADLPLIPLPPPPPPPSLMSPLETPYLNSLRPFQLEAQLKLSAAKSTKRSSYHNYI